MGKDRGFARALELIDLVAKSTDATGDFIHCATRENKSQRGPAGLRTDGID